MTTICETRVVLHGGGYPVPDKYSILYNYVYSNTTWLFNGLDEKWVVLQTFNDVSLQRNEPRTFAFHQEKSPCSCKDSILMYGEKETYDDLHELWELQCVEEENERNFSYRWIKFEEELPMSLRSNSAWSLYGFSVNESHICWLSMQAKKMWMFELLTARWYEKTILVDKACLTDQLSLDIQTGAYVKKLQLFIFSLFGNWFGLYNATENRIDCVHTNVSVLFGAIRIILFRDTIVFQAVYGREVDLQLWIPSTQNLSTFLKITHKSRLPLKWEFRRAEYNNRYPCSDVGIMDSSAALIRTEDSVLYQVQSFFSVTVRMWRLELDTLMWTLYDPDLTPPSDRYAAFSGTVNECVAYYNTQNRHLWIYSTNSRQWSKVVSRGLAPQHSKSFATMNSMSNGSLLIYGGIVNKPNSLWMATINDNVVPMTATWKRLCCDDDKKEKHPSHWTSTFWTSTLWNDTFYVCFGSSKRKNFDPTLPVRTLLTWNYSWNIYYTEIERGASKWHRKNMSWGSHRYYAFTSDWHPTAFGRIAVTVNQMDNTMIMADLTRKEYIMLEGYTSMFPKKSRFLSDYRMVGSKNSLLYLEYYYLDRCLFPINLYILDLKRCPPGMYSSDFSLYPCRPCPRGQYSDRGGSTHCTDCPPGLVSSSKGSTSVRNCTCAAGTCIHGQCIVRSDHTTVCICDAGFSGKACATPTSYLIGMGVVVGVLLIVAFYYCIKRVRKQQRVVTYTRIELERAEQTVEELSNIWSVDNDKVDFRQRIGKGSFGDVWTAEYRDQIVAVKVLKIKAEDCTDEQLQDFRDEGELLRSIFHANIVCFIGTGKTADNKPFIVLEYMERGSVRNELDNEYVDHPMELVLQVKYALHAAKGMRHLHNIDRMHRDLKCDNILINVNGIVKVADLGCTKIAPKIDDSGNVKEGSRAVGTAFFRAPKIFRGEAYNGAVDVYSYGITLWEIMTAKYPYFEKFNQGLTAKDILDQILVSDARPEFPVLCSNDLKKLAESC